MGLRQNVTEKDMEDKATGNLKCGPITEDEVNAAQTAWCDALVRIGQVYSEGRL